MIICDSLYRYSSDLRGYSNIFGQCYCMFVFVTNTLDDDDEVLWALAIQVSLVCYLCTKPSCSLLQLVNNFIK